MTKINKLIIDAIDKKIFLMIICDVNVYNVTHENSKTNYEKLTILISDFLFSRNLQIDDISMIYVNRGPGSFAGIRNSLSLVKAVHLVKKIDYYCYSFQDFESINMVKYEKIPYLCKKFNVKKNLINPIYIS